MVWTTSVHPAAPGKSLGGFAADGLRRLALDWTVTLNRVSRRTWSASLLTDLTLGHSCSARWRSATAPTCAATLVGEGKVRLDQPVDRLPGEGPDLSTVAAVGQGGCGGVQPAVLAAVAGGAVMLSSPSSEEQQSRSRSASGN